MGSSEEEQAEQLKAEGNKLFQASKYKEALAKYKQACVLCPSVPAYWSNAALCYQKLKKYDKMKDAAEKCLQVDDKFVKGYYRLAVAQRELDELTEALETLNVGKELANDNSDDFRLMILDVEERIELVKCLNCGKAETSTVCAKCRIASYCSPQCQKDHWKSHKPICSQSVQGRGTPFCNRCRKETPESEMRMCPKCGVTRYCSQQCMFEDLARHRPDCEESLQVQSAISIVEQEPYELFQEWNTRAMTFLGQIAMYALTKKQFMMQPPNFVIKISIKFNYNYMTYLPTKDPELMFLRDMDDYMRSRTEAMISDRIATATARQEFLHILWFERASSVHSMACHLVARDFQVCPQDEIIPRIKDAVNLNFDVWTSWMPIFITTVAQQVLAIRQADASNWSTFCIDALRIYTNKPLHKTHAVVIDLDMGFELGEVVVGRYELVKLDTVRDIFRKELANQPEVLNDLLSNDLDVENSPKLQQARVDRPQAVLLPVFFRAHDLLKYVFPTACDITEVLDEVPRLTKEQCDAKADELFRRLQAVSLPPVSSPSLVGVMPDVKPAR